jgi:hypothetical protein
MQSREHQKAKRRSESKPAPAPAAQATEVLAPPVPDQQNLRTAIILMERLRTSPQNTMEELFQATICGNGLSVDELLWLFHSKALTDVRTGRMFVQLTLRLRESLPKEKHKACDQLINNIIKSCVLSTLEVNKENPMNAAVPQLTRGRGVRNVKVLAEALQHQLVSSRQVTEILTLLSGDLQTHSIPQQDLRVLLLSHLLADVLHNHSSYWAYFQRIMGYVHLGCFHSDTQAALERLLEVSKTAPHFRALKHKSVPNQGSISATPQEEQGKETLQSPLVHCPYSMSA